MYCLAVISQLLNTRQQRKQSRLLHRAALLPLNHPPGTFPPSGGEGWDEGVRFVEREHLPSTDVSRVHEL
jgi:hypothetical protein